MNCWSHNNSCHLCPDREPIFDVIVKIEPGVKQINDSEDVFTNGISLLLNTAMKNDFVLIDDNHSVGTTIESQLKEKGGSSFESIVVEVDKTNSESIVVENGETTGPSSLNDIDYNLDRM